MVRPHFIRHQVTGRKLIEVPPIYPNDPTPHRSLLKDEHFIKCCELVAPGENGTASKLRTIRQAGKFKNKRGLAYSGHSRIQN